MTARTTEKQLAATRTRAVSEALIAEYGADSLPVGSIARIAVHALRDHMAEEIRETDLTDLARLLQRLDTHGVALQTLLNWELDAGADV